MVLFDTMGTVTLYTAITVALLITFGVAGNPFAVAFDFLRNLATSPRYFLHFAGLLLILLLNKNEMRLENNMNLTYDFTPFFHSIEGSIVASIQRMFEHPALTTVLAFLYIVVLQAILIASIGIYSYKNANKQMYYATCYAIMLNYFIAIPFFLFFPVNEVWAFDPQVKFLMLEAFPKFETEYRALSGLNNCFPSLHTSISATLAILAVRSGNKRWATLVCVCAALIIFSIFYLGIHWVIDMCGGLVLATFASTLGMKLAKGQLLRLPDRLPVRSFTREEIK